MQSNELSATFAENTDGTSLKVSSKCCPILDEETHYRRQVEDLSRTVANLESTIIARNAQIENTRRDKERLASELKKQQRCNRNLKQQLDDERFFYQKEKEHFYEEMQNRNSKCICVTSKGRHNQRREFDRIRESLEDENKELKNEILEKSEVTYNLCIKFLRMKDARDSLRQKFDRLLQEHLQVIAEMMEKLDEAREELNIIVSEKFHEPLPISKAKFLQIVQRNSKLVYENATLKLHVHQLTQNIERIKNDTQKTKTINVDARTIERLVECSRRRRSNEIRKNVSGSLSCDTNFDKSLSVSEATSANDFPIVDRSGDTKMVSAIKSRHCVESTIVDSLEFQKSAAKQDFHTAQIRSAPEIVQTTIFRQVQFSESNN